MLLTKLKQYVKDKRLVSLLELTSCFNIDVEIIRDMLKLLMTKGRVRQKYKTMNCGVKCIKCPPLTTEIYEWVEVV